MISSLELAKICGVSQGTVDRALHNRPGINPETRKRVLEAAEAQGYAPNPAARELMTGKSRLVGAIAPSFNSIFFMDIMDAMKGSLAEAGLRLLLTSAVGRDEFVEALEEFAARRMRGVVVVPPVDGMRLPEKVSRGMRIVTLLSPCATSDTTLFLAPDERQTGYGAVKALAAAGHRRILHLTYSRDAFAIRLRAEGYRTGVKKLCAEKPLVMRVLDAATLAETVTAKRITAVFCHNDWLAVRAIRALESEGMKVPRDVSVLGVDDSPTFKALWPGLSTMSYPRGDIAAKAAAWIATGAMPTAVPPCVFAPGSTITPPRG